MGATGLVTMVPSDEGAVEPAQISRQFMEVVELLVVGAEGAFDAAAALGVVGGC